MRPGVVLEGARRYQLLLDDVVEAELSDGDEDGAAGGPVGPAEQLAEALLARHAQHAVQGVLVAGWKEKGGGGSLEHFHKVNTALPARSFRIIRENGKPHRKHCLCKYLSATEGRPN